MVSSLSKVPSNIYKKSFIFSFVSANGRYPAPWSGKDAAAFVELGKQMFPEKAGRQK